MIISMIAAVTENRVIGKSSSLPWHLPADLARFRRLTWGHPIIMGRLTFETIGHPLAGRTNIIISRQSDYPPSGCIITHSVNAALAAAEETGTDEVFICGGGHIYRELLPRADRLYITLVHQISAGDTFFPVIQPDKFTLVSEETSHDAIPCTFKIFERNISIIT